MLPIRPFFLLLVSMPFLACNGAPDPLDLVQGVSALSSAPGYPGPMLATDSAWWPIAGGDEDSSFPSTFVLARQYGEGRVIALGSGALLNSVTQLDNAQFFRNAMRWLHGFGAPVVHYSSGHAERTRSAQLQDFAFLVESEGYALKPVDAPLTLGVLIRSPILVIGNAWTDFTDAEIAAIERYVCGGGGLLLGGLGWTWSNSSMGRTMDNYPMNQLGDVFGVRWIDGIISDPTHHLNNRATFHTLYPDFDTPSVNGAMASILDTHAGRSDLRELLNNPVGPELELRLEFIRAHELLSVATVELPAEDPKRLSIYDFFVNLIETEPSTYAKHTSLDSVDYPTSAWVRERAWRTWRDSVHITAMRRNAMIDTGSLRGRHADILRDHGIVILDNLSLDDAQLDHIHQLLDLIPAELHSLRSISVKSKLGPAPHPLSLKGIPSGVNIFGSKIRASVNPFPPDIEARPIPSFSAALAHEINHSVNAKLNKTASPLADWTSGLVADAGAPALNYLRSTVSDGFFQNAPQELIASIANQWFSDSAQTVELGLVRFDAGYPDPINQALHMANIYSLGNDQTWFYETDSEAFTTQIAVPLDRNEAGQISGIDVNGSRYAFDLDPEGRVLTYTETRIDPE